MQAHVAAMQADDVAAMQADDVAAMQADVAGVQWEQPSCATSSANPHACATARHDETETVAVVVSLLQHTGH